MPAGVSILRVLLPAVISGLFVVTADSVQPAEPEEESSQFRSRLTSGTFLIASRQLADVNFRRTVILITRHDSEGTAGLVINRVMNLDAEDAFPQIRSLTTDVGKVLVGGPVRRNFMQLLIKVIGYNGAATPVFDDVYLVSNTSFFEQLIQNRINNEAVRLYMGHAGWAAGQLEAEILRGDWHLWPADSASIFATDPDSVWPALIKQAAARWAVR